MSKTGGTGSRRISMTTRPRNGSITIVPHGRRGGCFRRRRPGRGCLLWPWSPSS
jgi:hypothetical protein